MSKVSGLYADAAAQAPAYVASLLAHLEDRDPFEVLAETPGVLGNLTAGLSEAQECAPEAPGKWSVRQVVAHLADSELVGGFRFRMVLAHDAPELPGYDQDRWAERLHYQETPAAVALEDFTLLRASTLRLLRRATPEDFKTRVMRHAERGDESLEKMVRLYASHDLVHRKQIERIRRVVGG